MKYLAMIFQDGIDDVIAHNLDIPQAVKMLRNRLNKMMWPEVYLVKYELVDKGSWIYPQNYRYIYYSNASIPVMIKKEAEYRNITKR